MGKRVIKMRTRRKQKRILRVLRLTMKNKKKIPFSIANFCSKLRQSKAKSARYCQI